MTNAFKNLKQLFPFTAAVAIFLAHSVTHAEVPRELICGGDTGTPCPKVCEEKIGKEFEKCVMNVQKCGDADGCKQSSNEEKNAKVKKIRRKKVEAESTEEAEKPEPQQEEGSSAL